MQEGRITDGPVTKVNVGRLTNGIFGFSFLILFFKLGLPDFANYAGDIMAEQYMLSNMPDIYNFVTIFLILAMLWAVMFHLFHQIAWIDRMFLYLHFILLMLVIFIPYTNNLAIRMAGNSIYSIPFSVLFHLNMLAIGLMLFIEWMYCQKKHALLKPEALGDDPVFVHTGLLIIPLTAIAGCVLAFYSFKHTQYIYIIAAIAFALISALMSESIRKKRAVMIMTPYVPASGGELQETWGVEGSHPQDMLEILINGIFALSLTMIVRSNILLPSLTEASIYTMNLKKTMDDGGNFLFTFMILAFFYIQFFEIMRHTRVSDWIVTGISLTFILSILFIPLTSLIWAISDKPGTFYSIIFHINVLVSGFLMIVLWRYISTHPTLITPGTDTAIVGSLSVRLLLLPITALAGSFLDSWQLTFDLIPYGFLYLFPGVFFVYLSWKSDVWVKAEPAETSLPQP